MSRHYGNGWRTDPHYSTWAAMVQRCTNPNNPKYSRYGGRGICVCDRWRSNFGTFLSDMGARPTPKHTIDRVDNDGNYEPSNCRWATMAEQCRNRAQNVLLTIDGVTSCAADWATKTGIPLYTVLRRKRRGLPDAACLAPSQRPGRPPSTIAVQLCIVDGCNARAVWESADGARCSLHDIARHLETSDDREEFAESYAAEARIEREREDCR